MIIHSCKEALLSAAPADLSGWQAHFWAFDPPCQHALVSELGTLTDHSNGSGHKHSS